MSASLADGVRAVAEPAVARAGLVLDALSIATAGRRRVLRVVVDLPADVAGGVSMDAVAEASQHLSAALDETEVMGAAPYVLEVTSPGTDRPLVERRHWLRARGRLVRITLAAGGSAEGRLTMVDDDGVLLGESRHTWAEITSGRVEVEFGAVAGAGDPVDEADLSDDHADDDESDDESDEGAEED